MVRHDGCLWANIGFSICFFSWCAFITSSPFTLRISDPLHAWLCPICQWLLPFSRLDNADEFPKLFAQRGCHRHCSHVQMIFWMTLHHALLLRPDHPDNGFHLHKWRYWLYPTVCLPPLDRDLAWLRPFVFLDTCMGQFAISDLWIISGEYYHFHCCWQIIAPSSNPLDDLFLYPEVNSCWVVPVHSGFQFSILIPIWQWRWLATWQNPCQTP